MPDVIKLSDQHNLVESKHYPCAWWKFDKFNPVQSRLLETFQSPNNIAIAAATSAGKAQPLWSKILTPNGFVSMASIQVGDLVVGSGGQSVKVMGVFPQGQKLIYRVHFSDGTRAECCDDHLWAVRTKYDKYRGRPFRVKPLKDLLNDIKTSDGQNKWFVPLIEPEFGDCVTELPIKPYAFGALLGDGGIKHRVILSSGDDELLERVQSELPDGCLLEFVEDYDYQITGGMSLPGKAHGFKKTNLIKYVLEQYGLFGCGSCDKFIPEVYLNADAASRLELLRGLMDTDGTSNGLHKAAEFTSCSRRLADDVCQLARSLGAATEVRKGESHYINEEGKKIECQPRYRVTVNLGSNLNPFFMKRKAGNQGVGLAKGRNRSIDRVECLWLDECQCISVDSPDHLYVTDDFILTHNTVCAEMYMAHEINVRGGRSLYIGPLRALAREKERDWTKPEHHFFNKKISICTGDYRLTAARQEELDESDIVVMTPEMLASRSRNHMSEKSNFLKNVGTVVFDESHLLTVPGRGDHIEIALMKLTQLNPNIRIVLLSATMPNVDEVCGWMSHLTQRDSFCLESTYRPVPLNTWYEAYYDGEKSYDANESQKVATACGIVEYYPDDKFLIFVHTKRTGRMMVETLEEYGVKAEFHNADLEAKERERVEDGFKNDPKFRVIVATSTLAWGCYAHGSRLLGDQARLLDVEDVNVGTQLLCPVDGKFQNRKVVRVHDFTSNGFEITLESGEQMVVSQDHVFYAAKGREVPNWQDVNKLSVGDYLATPSDLGIYDQSTIQFDRLWYLRGFAFGDGCLCDVGIHADGSQKAVLDICLGKADPHEPRILKLFEDEFSSKCNLRLDKDGISHLVTKRREIVNEFLPYLPLGRKSGGDDIPVIAYSNKEWLANFLRGWFDADGGTEDHGNGNFSVGLSCISRRAIESARAILLAFGIRSSFGKKRMKDSVINGRFQKAKREWSYRLRIFGHQNLERFQKMIGFQHPNKNQNLVEYLDQIDEHKPSKDIVPARALIETHLSANKLSPSWMRERHGIDLWTKVHVNDCSRTILDGMVQETSVRTELNTLLDQPYYWSRIKTINKCDSTKFRELEVEDPHAYVGNNVISHNCNFPARRVIITGVHRGLQRVHNYDIQQMIGRCGRLGLDDEGDAYILVPESTKKETIQTLKKVEPIRSTLFNYVGTEENPHYKTLAFHVVSEIHQGNVKTKDAFHDWISRSLAHYQGQDGDNGEIDRTLELLTNYRAILMKDGDYQCTGIGTVASMFYYSPFDVSCFKKNFQHIFDNNLGSEDFAVSLALGNIDSHMWGIANREEKAAMAIFVKKATALYGDKFTPSALKTAFAYYGMLKGKKAPELSATIGMLFADLDRTMQVVTATDSMSGKWGQTDYFRRLRLRLMYGADADLVDLVQISKIGGARAKKLQKVGITSVDGVLSLNAAQLGKVMGVTPKVAEEALASARQIKLQDLVRGG